jgi:hypothetical protein
VQRLLAVGLLVVAAALATGASAAGEGIVGEFELHYSRHQPENPSGRALGVNPTPSLEMTLDGSFAVQDGNFLADLSIPLPGGSDEKVSLLLRNDPEEAYLLYPDTMNYRAISHGNGAWPMFELMGCAASTYFGATRDALKSQGIQLSYLGIRQMDGEQLRAYSVSMRDKFPLEAKGDEDAEWNLTLYFSGKPERLRVAQAKSATSEVRITLNDVRYEAVPAARFKVPKDYYALEPLIISEETPSAESDDQG